MLKSNPDRPRGTVIERRFMLSMAVVILVLMGPVVVIVQFRAAEFLQTSAQTRGLSMARSIAAVSTPSLLSYNYVGLEEAARSTSQDEGVAYIIIHDKEGLIAGNSRELTFEARESSDSVSTRAVLSVDDLVQRVTIRGNTGNAEDVYDIAVPVYVADSPQKWGTIRVGISLKPVQQAVARITYLLLLLAGLGFCLCLLGARAASRRITRPLQKLRDGTLALAGGNLTHRIEIRTGDEIEDLAAHFNRMADEVEARQAEARQARSELEKLNASLEEEVRTRTEALRYSERRYRVLVEGSPMGIAIIQSGKVVYGNPAYRNMVGEDMPAVTEVLDESDRLNLAIELEGWSRAEMCGPFEVTLRGSSGPARHVEMRWMAIEMDARPADLCMLVDVTAVRKLQEQVAVSDKLRALGELASGVAHDFNNVLAVILGRCQLMARRTDDDTILKGLSIIEKAASDGGQTVKRIQDFARMRKEATHGVHDVGDLVTDVVEITRSIWKNKAEGRGVHIKVDTRIGHTGKITGNAAELREALTNLVVNAVDAMPEGGSLTFTTSDEEVDGKSVVRLDFSDTGIGIPEEAQGLIFDPFFSTKGNLGTGLGLSITYGIITRHRGTVALESAVGKGTTFTLRFPVALDTDGADTTKAVNHPFIPATILVVDDEPEIRTVLKEGLTQAGYRVVDAEGGREAIKLLNLARYDMVLTDLGMPEVTGWDVVKAAGDMRSEAILGLVTGWGETLDPNRVRQANITFVVSKPFDLESLLQEVRGALAARSLAA